MATKDTTRDCTDKCMSQSHGDALVSALTLREPLDKELALYLSSLCANGGGLVDGSGRTVLHMAASLGRRDLVQWLVQRCGASLNIQDEESGYTPLHRSIFYGQLNVAVVLLQMGADSSILDNEHLSPIELAMKDRLPGIVFCRNLPCELYVWGTNTNYNLGTDNLQGRLQPEALDFFRKFNRPVSIAQVHMEKFHTIIVSACGRVWTCGHGQGGRLGLGSERTVLSPVQVHLGSITKGFVQNPKSVPGQPEVCVAAAVGRDHTVLLMESYAVFVFGLNTHHVLGLNPPPSNLLEPQRLLPLKNNEDMKFHPVGVCAGRFHSVIWSHGELWTFGLNAGQLGHLKSSEKTVILPKPVNALFYKDSDITQVVASDGATVVVVNSRHIWVLHEYLKTKLPMRYSFVIEQVAVVGGHLDSELDPNNLSEKGVPLKIAAISKEGSVFLWEEKDHQMTRCILSPNRQLRVVNIHLNLSRSSILLVTDDGEAYMGETKPYKKKMTDTKPLKGRRVPQLDGEYHVMHKQTERGPLKEFIDPALCYSIYLERLSHVHRAVKITCDPKGRNFALLQTHPSAFLNDIPELSCDKSGLMENLSNLLSEANEWDTLHDIVFEVENRRFPAHQYIISRHSNILLKMIKEANKAADNGQAPVIKISDIDSYIFEHVLRYLYAGECLLTHPVQLKAMKEKVTEDHHSLGIKTCDEVTMLTKPAQKPLLNEVEEQTRQEDGDLNNPVSQARAAGKKLGLSKFVGLLNNVKYDDGKVVWNHSSGRKRPVHKSDTIKLDWREASEFCDVHILSKDGVSFHVHKCVLAARSEYFHSMLAGGWVESRDTKDLQLPLDQHVLVNLFDYIYMDSTPLLENINPMDFELAMRSLIAADLLLINPFKVRCEAAIASLLTLRNVKVALELAYTYNADGLRDCCYQFVCLNLSSILETGVLYELPSQVLDGIRDYYRRAHPRMESRIITPYSTAPSSNLVKETTATSTIIWNEEMNYDVHDNMSNQKKGKPQSKKKARFRRSSETQRTHSRTDSISSTNSDDFDTSTDPEPLDWSELIEKEESEMSQSLGKRFHVNFKNVITKAGPSDQWVKVLSNSKAQKIVQARLKAAAMAREELLEPSFSRLSVKQEPIATTQPMNPPSPSSSQLKPLQSNIIPAKAVAKDVIEKHFPQLGCGDNLKRGTPKLIPAVNEIRVTKLSQKQRKRLAAEEGTPPSSPGVAARGWEHRDDVPGNSTSLSLAEIMQQQLQRSRANLPSPSTPINIKGNRVSKNNNNNALTSHSSGSPWWKVDHSISPLTPPTTPTVFSDSSPGKSDFGVKFSDIMADEMKQKENWTRMRAKPLSYTQIEDKAIDDLINFYNANEASEERITVRRVLSTQVALPVWVTSKH